MHATVMACAESEEEKGGDFWTLFAEACGHMRLRSNVFPAGQLWSFNGGDANGFYLCGIRHICQV